MPIAPITEIHFDRRLTTSPRLTRQGKLRKQLIVDLSVAFGLGITGGYAFWFGYHIPAVRKRDAYYAKLEQEGTGTGHLDRAAELTTGGYGQM